MSHSSQFTYIHKYVVVQGMRLVISQDAYSNIPTRVLFLTGYVSYDVSNFTGNIFKYTFKYIVTH